MTSFLHHFDGSELLLNSLNHTNSKALNLIPDFPLTVNHDSLLAKRNASSNLDDILVKKIKTVNSSETASTQGSPESRRRPFDVNSDDLSQSYNENQHISGVPETFRIPPFDAQMNNLSSDLAVNGYNQLQNALNILKSKILIYQGANLLHKSVFRSDQPKEVLPIPPFPEEVKMDHTMSKKEQNVKKSMKFLKEELGCFYGDVEFPFLSVSAPLEEINTFMKQEQEVKSSPLVKEKIEENNVKTNEKESKMEIEEERVEKVKEIVKKNKEEEKVPKIKKTITSRQKALQLKKMQQEKLRKKEEKKKLKKSISKTIGMKLRKTRSTKNKMEEENELEEEKEVTKTEKIETIPKKEDQIIKTKEKQDEDEKSSNKNKSQDQDKEDYYYGNFSFGKKRSERQKNKWQVAQDQKLISSGLPLPNILTHSSIMFGGFKKKSNLTPIGDEHQADISNREKTERRKPKLHWDPSIKEEEELEKFFQDLRKMIRYNFIQEKAISFLSEHNYDLAKTLQYIKANRTKCLERLKFKTRVEFEL